MMLLRRWGAHERATLNGVCRVSTSSAAGRDDGAFRGRASDIGVTQQLRGGAGDDASEVLIVQCSERSEGFFAQR